MFFLATLSFAKVWSWFSFNYSFSMSLTTYFSQNHTFMSHCNIVTLLAKRWCFIILSLLLNNKSIFQYICNVMLHSSCSCFYITSYRHIYCVYPTNTWQTDLLSLSVTIIHLWRAFPSLKFNQTMTLLKLLPWLQTSPRTHRRRLEAELRVHADF